MALNPKRPKKNPENYKATLATEVFTNIEGFNQEVWTTFALDDTDPFIAFDNQLAPRQTIRTSSKMTTAFSHLTSAKVVSRASLSNK